MAARSEKTHVDDSLWDTIREEVAQDARMEPILASFLHATILKHKSLEDSLSFHLAGKLATATLPSMLIREVIDEALASDAGIQHAVRADIRAVRERDPATSQYSLPLLY